MKASMVSNFIVVMYLSIPTLSQASKQDSFSATITGQVKDAYRNPVANARVSACLTPRSPGAIPQGYTDQLGNFSIVVRTPGTYRMYAGKEDLSYPTTSALFYDVDQVGAPEITVGDQQVVDAGIVLLNSQGARLILRLIDAETGQPIKEANIEFRRDDNLDRLGTGLGEEAAGKVTVLVPSMPIRIEIQAPGYEDWYYGGNGTSEQALSLCLVPGTTEEIEALLTQKRQKEVTGSP